MILFRSYRERPNKNDSSTLSKSRNFILFCGKIMKKLQINIKRATRSSVFCCSVGWYWELSDLSNNLIVCRSCNYKDINNPGDYTTKATARGSAKRFIKDYLQTFKVSITLN